MPPDQKSKQSWRRQKISLHTLCTATFSGLYCKTIMIVIMTIINYDRKTFIVQATEWTLKASRSGRTLNPRPPNSRVQIWPQGEIKKRLILRLFCWMPFWSHITPILKKPYFLLCVWQADTPSSFFRFFSETKFCKKKNLSKNLEGPSKIKPSLSYRSLIV